MKKFLTAIVFIIMMVMMPGSNAFAANDEITVYVDAVKVQFDVLPQIIDGRTMVPIRAIFEKMGAGVNWDEKTRTAVSQKGDIEVKMTVGSKDMYINGEIHKMDVEPQIIGGRTLAPARYVAEAFDATVGWNDEKRMVVISSKDVYSNLDYPDIPDIAKCYNIPLQSEVLKDGFRIFTYVYSDMTNDEHYSYLFDNSAKVLGGYREEVVKEAGGVMTIAYTKWYDENPTFYIDVCYDEEGNMIFDLKIPE